MKDGNFTGGHQSAQVTIEAILGACFSLSGPHLRGGGLPNLGHCPSACSSDSGIYMEQNADIDRAPAATEEKQIGTHANSQESVNGCKFQALTQG